MPAQIDSWFWTKTVFIRCSGFGQSLLITQKTKDPKNIARQIRKGMTKPNPIPTGVKGNLPFAAIRTASNTMPRAAPIKVAQSAELESEIIIVSLFLFLQLERVAENALLVRVFP